MTDIKTTNEDYGRKIHARTELLLGTEDLACLRQKTVLIAGCGGVGGITLITLARIGIGRFLLSDPSTFDEPDVNRQLAATRRTLGRNKAYVYEEMLAEIDPTIEVHVHQEGMTENNLNALINSADLVIDALDYELTTSVRMRFYQQVQNAGRYCLSSPIIGFGTLMLVAAPDGMSLEPIITRFVKVGSPEAKRLPAGFGRHFFPEHISAFERHVAQGTIPTCSISTCFSAAVQSSEAALILLRDKHPEWREPICLPELLVIEPLRPEYRVLPYTELFPDLDPDFSE